MSIMKHLGDFAIDRAFDILLTADHNNRLFWAELVTQRHQGAMNLVKFFVSAEPSLAEAAGSLLTQQVEGGWLTRLARGRYWGRLLPVLAAEAESVLVRVVAELGAAHLHSQAGSVLLWHQRFHPALHSSSAAMAALRRFVRSHGLSLMGISEVS